MARFLSIILFLFSIFLVAQVRDPLENPGYDFVKYESNELRYNEQSSNLPFFFHKMDSVVQQKSGNINIAHIGGSHVQAGAMSNRIRCNILSQYPDLVGRRGLIFPYSAARKCNNPADYTVQKSDWLPVIRNVFDTIKKPLGVSGIAVYTSENQQNITINLVDTLFDYATDRIIVLGYPEKKKSTPKIEIAGRKYSPSSVDLEKKRYEYEFDTIVQKFTVVLPSYFVLTGILLDSDEPGITLHSIGVNGADVPAYLKCDYFVDDLQLINPDLVIFGIGINDASKSDFDTAVFRSNYLQLIDRIKSVNPDCAFIFMTNNDSFRKNDAGKYEVNEKGVLARDVFYRLAEDVGGAVWDKFEIMGGLESMEVWYQNKMAKSDRIHFTKDGYLLIGDLFTDAFFDAFECEIYRNR